MEELLPDDKFLHILKQTHIREYKVEGEIQINSATLSTEEGSGIVKRSLINWTLSLEY